MSNNVSSRSDTVSGRKVRWSARQSSTSSLRTTVASPGDDGYDGWLAIRMKPFSVIGQVAHPRWPSAANQAWAGS